jgi:phosphate starvation-inducible PhoH-like protein
MAESGPDTEARRLEVPDNVTAAHLYGRQEENLRILEDGLGVRIIARGNELTISGPPEATALAADLLARLTRLAMQGREFSGLDVQYAVQALRRGEVDQLEELWQDAIGTTVRGRVIRPKTLGQQRYVDAIRRHTMCFCIGPAGTGKTYLAMAMAIAAFRAREVSRIVLTRPLVDAGEKLGFLPGDLQDKVDPYLKPLYDAIYDIMGVEAYERHHQRGAIEVAPLAYMRGRTLDDAFVILDEAQNTTREQMKMFLTRLGFGSKAVITGDVTQIDLPPERESGLLEAQHVLAGVADIAFVHLDEGDVVRHPLVQAIIRAYDRMDAVRAATPTASAAVEP